MPKDSMKLNVSGIAGATILNTIIDTIKRQFCDQIIQEITDHLSHHLQSLPDSIKEMDLVIEEIIDFSTC